MRPASNSVRRAQPLLGTIVDIEVAGAALSDMRAAVEAAFGAIARVHGLMSFHEATSDVARLNREASARPLDVHPWTFQVLEAAVDLHRRSAGVFDIAVAPVLQKLGLLPRTPADCLSLSERTATTDAIELLSDHRVRFLHPGVRIDLGGIAKGFAVDSAIDVLRAHGMPRGIVNAGGDLAAFGPDAETVHLRDPRDPSRLLLRLEIENQALASSARRFDPLQSTETSGPAIVDPRTEEAVCAASAATVRAPTCIVADALTKVVMVAGADAAPVLEHYQAGALLVSASGDIEMTEDLQGAVCLAA